MDCTETKRAFGIDRGWALGENNIRRFGANMADSGYYSGGGSGTRLYPLTMAVSKLLPIYEQANGVYPTSVLISGDQDILVITATRSGSVPTPSWRRSQWGIL